MTYNTTNLSSIINNWVVKRMVEPNEDVCIDRAYRRTTDEIVFNTGDNEMLRIAKDGFWVRGVRVAQDEGEAESVYRNFQQWLVWAQLNRD
jgi:hypothetical protein